MSNEERHARNLVKLAVARAQEKSGRRLRKAGNTESAIEALEDAQGLYVDSALAFHEQGESKLAHEVRHAIERCRKITNNLRHPKDRRPATTTPRPDCLACGNPLRRYRLDRVNHPDGWPREWGDYGDQRFCGLRCGWRWACAHSPQPRVNP